MIMFSHPKYGRDVFNSSKVKALSTSFLSTSLVHLEMVEVKGIDEVHPTVYWCSVKDAIFNHVVALISPTVIKESSFQKVAAFIMCEDSRTLAYPYRLACRHFWAVLNTCRTNQRELITSKRNHFDPCPAEEIHHIKLLTNIGIAPSGHRVGRCIGTANVATTTRPVLIFSIMIRKN